MGGVHGPYRGETGPGIWDKKTRAPGQRSSKRAELQKQTRGFNIYINPRRVQTPWGWFAAARCGLAPSPRRRPEARPSHPRSAQRGRWVSSGNRNFHRCHLETQISPLEAGGNAFTTSRPQTSHAPSPTAPSSLPPLLGALSLGGVMGGVLYFRISPRSYGGIFQVET